MKNFRVAILDNPKVTLNDPTTQKLFSDMLSVKQINFTRTSDAYIAMGPLDMISTHVLIYDTSHLLTPKLVLAIRVCYEARANAHNVKLPIQEYCDAMPLKGQANYAQFRRNKNELVDCNAWFVDPDYSFSKTGLKLSDIGFFFVALSILRNGNDHLCGCSNERYKASRWVKEIGDLVDPVEFIHPKVPDPHHLILINNFSRAWLTEGFKQYDWLVNSAFEQIAEKTKYSFEDIRAEVLTTESARLAA